MKGKNGTTSFLPNKKMGGQVRLMRKSLIFLIEKRCVCLRSGQTNL